MNADERGFRDPRSSAVIIPLVSTVKQSLASKTHRVIGLGGMKRSNRSAKALVNTEELGRAVRRRREELGLSLRDVASKTSVSASTLSRIENGTGKPDADNIARLTAWLDVPMERILSGRDPHAESSQAVIYYPQEPTPEIVEAHLRADRNLTPETAAALSELFRVAYTQFSKSTGDKGSKKRR
jgi:transcriptional regulator with XRE-family HTH domain